MLIVPDNDVVGAVTAIRHFLNSPEWARYAEAVQIRFLHFRDLGLVADSTDREVWLACQRAGVVLVTGNRSGGEDSLDDVIRELADPTAFLF